MVDRRKFLKSSAAFATGGAVAAALGVEMRRERGILVRFLGSGASGWDRAWLKSSSHARRQSSILVENKIVVDFTDCGFDLMPVGLVPRVLFVTHSHGDHFSPQAVVRLGVETVYAHSSWAEHARSLLAEAARKQNLPVPAVIGIGFAETIEIDDVKVTAVPSIHGTSLVTGGRLEQTAMYLIEKGESRLLYATDTAGISGDAARMIGIDCHISEEKYQARFKNNPFVRRPQPLTALIMEATSGERDTDFRMFAHAGVKSVARIVTMLKSTGRFTPPEGQKAMITHLALRYRHWPVQKINAEISPELSAAADGLEIRLG